MNTTELIERVRLGVFTTAANHPDYTDAVIMTELWNQLLKVFGRNIINARSGYWLAQDYWTSSLQLNGGMIISPRAYGSNLEKVELSQVAYQVGDFFEIEEVEEGQVNNLDLPVGQTGSPYSYVQRNDLCQLIPFPNASVLAGRLTFYIRPSKLVAPQDGTQGSTLRGFITGNPAVTGNRQSPTSISITMNALPFDMTLNVPAAPSGAGVPIDIVRGGEGSWHEVIYRGTYSFAGGTTGNINDAQLNPGAFVPLSIAALKMRQGDYVRLAGQSEWPALPDDYHDCLADCATIRILKQLNMSMKADDLVGMLSSDLDRFQDLITPRAKNSAKDIVAPQGLYRGSSKGWAVKFP